MAGVTRTDRISGRVRNDKWKLPPLRIEMSECINCDTCLRHCPPQFGAIFNHGMDVIILPELCSGCGKCLPPVCPVDCIYTDPAWAESSDEWWEEPLGPDDRYV
jgi:electron transport complex protein RnfB